MKQADDSIAGCEEVFSIYERSLAVLPEDKREQFRKENEETLRNIREQLQRARGLKEQLLQHLVQMRRNIEHIKEIMGGI